MNYRITFRMKDERGTADYVRDVIADTLIMAITQARWQLEHQHPETHNEYRAYMAVEIER